MLGPNPQIAGPGPADFLTPASSYISIFIKLMSRVVGKFLIIL
jgi:hypothetical protein